MANKLSMTTKAIGDFFALINSIFHFIFRHMIEILIICGTIYIIFWMFESGFIKRLTDYIIKLRESKGGEKECLNQKRKKL